MKLACIKAALAATVTSSSFEHDPPQGSSEKGCEKVAQAVPPSKKVAVTIPQWTHTVTATALTFYTLYSLFSLVAWVSHLGYRLPWLQPILLARGYAYQEPVDTVYDLFKHNLLNAFLFILPHSLLRPPTLKKYVGYRYARLVYCAMAAASCHLLTAQFVPLKGDVLFTLPVPKLAHDLLSLSMLIFSGFCVVMDTRTYVILGFYRACYGPNSAKDKFPQGLSPRMDIITWMGYCTWLTAGNAGFVLFSGLSILPYEVYAWDIITRVVAASYLRARSQGFRIWVGQIESTHHFIWILRAMLVVVAVWFNSSYELGWRTVSGMVVAGTFVAILMDKLEKIATK